VADEARLGIYLHALQDRVSHHVCGDDSHLTGPYTPMGPRTDDFVSNMQSSECTQQLHVLRHAWETGVPQSSVPARDRTTAAALAVTWDELSAYARTRGFLRPDAASARDRVLAALVTAIEVADAAARVRSIRDVGCAEGATPMPGHGACPTPMTADAGASRDAATDVSEAIDTAVSDAPGADAGTDGAMRDPLVDASPRDANPMIDGGAPVGANTGGCGCRATHRGSGSSVASLLTALIGWVARRRRDRRSARETSPCLA
jgi:hypothetical protein